jgi:two-component system sensor histidine kinase QseC
LTVQPSLFRHLLGWALGALVLVWATFVYFGHATGAHEADELTDGHLASVASLLLKQRVSDFAPAPDTATLGGLDKLRAHDYQQSLSVVIWDGAGRVIARTGEAPTPPFSEREGFETLALGAPPEQWRSFARWDGPAHDRRIAVLLSLAERDGLADDIADQVAAPGLWLLPVVALVLTLAIRRGLRPLAMLSHQVHQLDIHRDTTLQAPPHQEFREVVKSIDTLMDRYNAALRRERQLASEVAHELRTPLASLVINAAALRGELSPAEHEQVARRITEDAARAGAVMADLLALARASRTELAESAQPTDLAELARAVAAEYAQAAVDSGHELSVDALQPCVIDGHPVLLQIALRNLIENALQHTPGGTHIDVRVTADPATLEVRDDGPSAPSGGSTAHAGLGLGLGHQVVQRIVAVHDGSFEVAEHADRGCRIYRMVIDRGAACEPAGA